MRMFLIMLRWDNMQSGCDTHCIILLQVEDSRCHGIFVPVDSKILLLIAGRLLVWYEALRVPETLLGSPHIAHSGCLSSCCPQSS